MWIDNKLNYREPKCMNPEFAVFMGNMILMTPLSLLIQSIFNRVIKKSYEKIAILGVKN